MPSGLQGRWGDPVLLGGEAAGERGLPGGGGQDPAVGERDRAAAGQPVVPGALHVVGEAGPDEGDDGAVAVVGVDAGAADLDQVGADGGEGREVELPSE